MCAKYCLFLVATLIYNSDANQKTDKEKMQGVWLVEKQDWGKEGNQIADIMPHFLRLEITGDECTAVLKGSDDATEESHKVTLILDPGHKPPYFDSAVNGKKTSIKGIYRFDGTDLLVIAYGNKDNYRPKGFDPNTESIWVLTLKRKK